MVPAVLEAIRARYFKAKRLDDLARQAGETRLARSLGAWDLTTLGVGAIVGAGVFALTGVVAAEHAGPATSVAFVVAAFVSLLTALAYAELATLMPLGGSAYTYAFASSGELPAWLVAWSLILSYAIGNAAVASSFSDNFTGLAAAVGVPVPDAWAAAPDAGGLFDVPSFLVVMLVTVLLLRPVRESARANTVLVVTKVGILLLFIGVGAFRVDPGNWTPFAPEGTSGVFAGAALIFFAFIGFDAVSTAAEETRNPQRDLPRGILWSLVLVTALFVAVSLVLTGLVPSSLLNTGEPLAVGLRETGLLPLAAVMNVGGLLATLSVLLVFQLAATRILLTLARDGLLPSWLAKLSARHATPNRISVAVGLAVGLAGALFPIGPLVALTNIATLFAFAFVMFALLVLRRTAPHAHRVFRCPFVPWVPLAGIAATLALIVSLGRASWLGFAAWMGLGLMVYAAYGAPRSRSRSGGAEDAEGRLRAVEVATGPGP